MEPLKSRSVTLPKRECTPIFEKLYESVKNLKEWIGIVGL